MNLHDWIDEACDVLDIDPEVDEGLVLDLAKTASHQVQRPAAPVTAYLLGYAAGQREARPEEIERLAERLEHLAERWEKPADFQVPMPRSVDDIPEKIRRLIDADAD